MQPSVVILIGPPGSGKGTQSQLLSEKLNLYYLETARIIEQKFNSAKKGDYVEVKGKKYSLLKEKELFDKGILCSPPFASHLVQDKIKELFKLDKSLVMAGSPRTLFEGKEVIPLLKKLYGSNNIEIIVLTLSEKESIFRNSHRRICSLIRHPILYNEETKNLSRCPLDGSKLTSRTLDKPEIIKVRLKEYKERTLPLIDYFKEQGLKIKKVAGEKTPEALHKNILKVLR